MEVDREDEKGGRREWRIDFGRMGEGGCVGREGWEWRDRWGDSAGNRAGGFPFSLVSVPASVYPSQFLIHP